jgi:DNA-binding transcriptional LysR family regulator
VTRRWPVSDANAAIAMTLPVFSGVYRAVSQSDLIALIPHQLALQVAPNAGLSIYSAPMAMSTRAQIVMVWHKTIDFGTRPLLAA